MPLKRKGRKICILKDYLNKSLVQHYKLGLNSIKNFHDQPRIKIYIYISEIRNIIITSHNRKIDIWQNFHSMKLLVLM